jgi:hypothetical protein
MNFKYFVSFLIIIGCYGKKFHFYTGKWLLRSTNDHNFKKGVTYLYVGEKDIIIKKKIAYGFFQNIYNMSGRYNYIEDKNILNINFNTIHTFTNSVFGIEIPIINKKEELINNTIKYTCYIENYNKIYLYDYKTKSHYLFDLYINDYNKYKIETSLNNFLFLQTINFIISTFLHISLRHIILNNLF